MSSVIRTRDDWTPWYERTKAELTRLAGAEIHVGILGSADSELLRIAAVHEFGATIHPRNAKNLAIPLRPDMKGKSPRDVEGAFFLDNGENRFICRKKGKKGDQLDFLFLLLPSFLGGFVPKDWGVLARNVLEGIVRIAIFLMFMWSVSHMKDIRRTFEYHGAEHKTIFCYEAGEELTVENVRKQGKYHPRCGTSFMFVLIIIATIVSSIVFSIIDITNPFLRMLAHLILLPLVVGISYEFNRYAGRSESLLSRALRWPGLMVQHLTVFEPNDSMIEVAITAMKAVIPDDGSDEW